MSELVICLFLLSILIIAHVTDSQYLDREKTDAARSAAAVVDAASPSHSIDSNNLTSSSSPSSSSSSATSGGVYISEELWPREKSLIKIKIVEHVPRVIDVWKSRKQENYLNEAELDFDSPFKTLVIDNCTLDFRSHSDASSSEPIATHADLKTSAGNIQLQISGGTRCKVLPLHALHRQERDNLTHLVVRDTGIQSIPRFLFGKAGLERLLRLDVIANPHLREIKSRAFDGLSRLSYLSLINNHAIEHLDIESFAGLKGLEELIFLGNGRIWSSFLFQSILHASSVRILPNLVHLHVSGSHVPSKRESDEQGQEDHITVTSASSSRGEGRPVGSARVQDNSESLPVTSTPSPSTDPHAAVQPLVRIKSEDRVVKIGKDDLKQLSQIKYLQLSSCDLTFVHPLAFLPMLNNLLSLNLAGNRRLDIQSLKRSLSVFQEGRGVINKLDLSDSISGFRIPRELLIIVSKTNITELFLCGVSWDSLKEGDLPPMPSLRTLHIDRSQIATIDERTFIGFDSLSTLSLRGNMLTELPLNLLEPLVELTFLDISGYKKHEMPNGQLLPFQIPRKFFLHGTKLKEVIFSYKDLDPMPRNFFLGLFKAERVHLRGCGLKFIEYLTFFPLQSIEYLDLSENEELISSVRETHEDTFVGLEAIHMIRMSHCNITSRDLNDFNIFRRIQENVRLLDLSHNNISTINRNSFLNFTELRHLDLSHNEIKSWANYTIFSRNNFITTLDVSSNNITHLTAEMIGDFRKLKNLSIAHNPFECDCLWRGPLLLLNQKEARNHLLARNFQEQIEMQLQSLVKRQHQIVTEAFSSPDQAPPKSVIDWFNTTTIHFLMDHHPLRSKNSYFCHTENPDTGLMEAIVMKDFFDQTCRSPRAKRMQFSFALLSVIATILLLLTVGALVAAFIYESTLKKLFTMVEDDFLHNYAYDAFVSYNVNDSDWVLNKLIPNMEGYDPYEGAGASPDALGHEGRVTSRIKLCVYERDFLAGKGITECITEAIKTSRKVILVISGNFIHSPWCRFEADLAHNTLMDQNREGLIMIRLEEFPIDSLESIAPQLHFLLKTRIYLDWLQISESGEEIFWKKLRRALGFTTFAPYGTVKQYYQNYWFKKNSASERQQSRVRAIMSQESIDATEAAGKRVESRDFLVPSICVTQPNEDLDDTIRHHKERSNKISIGVASGRKRASSSFETCIRMKDLERKVRQDEEEGSSETGSKVSATEDSAISSSGGLTSRTMSTDEDDEVDEDEEAVFGDVEDEESSTSGCESSSSSLHRDRMTRRKIAISLLAEALHANHDNNKHDEQKEMGEITTPNESEKRPQNAASRPKIAIIEEG